MAKQIIYTIRDNGVDGRAPTTTVFASMNEDERDRVFDHSKNKAYFSKGEVIADMVDGRYKSALAKLDGIDRLALGLPQRTL